MSKALMWLLCVLRILRIGTAQFLNNSLPPDPIGKSIRHPQTYFGYEQHYSSRQCEVLSLLDGGGGGVRLDFCKGSCDELSPCSAFNFKFNRGNNARGRCVLRDCGPDPPYPIGESNDGWKGYTREHIEFGYSFYHGPYENYFTIAQGCGLLVPKQTEKTYVECEQHCDKIPTCTGFNFDLKNWACELRDCNSPTSIPEGHLEIWESWSKARIPKTRRPKYKCPSLHCGKDAERKLGKGTWEIVEGSFGDELEYRGDGTETKPNVEVEFIPLTGGCKPGCLNGVCGVSNVCICNLGWIGTYCETSLCNPKCLGGSKCTGPNYCTCNQGVVGAFCHHPDHRGVCKPGCLNGECGVANVCICTLGWIGTYCETPLCNPKCLGGKCTGPNHCTCKQGWVGAFCHHQSTSHYQGPYEFHWDEKQGCSHIVTWPNKTNAQCEIECDKHPDCTGINVHIKHAKCEMYSCPTSFTPPEAYQNDKQGYSKEKITVKDTSAYIILREGFAYSSRQCREIGIYPTRNLYICKRLCDDDEKCTAFNFNAGYEGGACVLRACGLNAPYPIGEDRTSLGWQAYSLARNKLDGDRKAKYYGPYGSYWHIRQGCYKQGPTFKDATYVECEEKCDQDQQCTGFNFDLKHWSCDFQVCPSATIIPNGVFHTLAPESWSKEKITNPEPSPRCPSLACTRSSLSRIEAVSRRCTDVGNSCNCSNNPWCFFSCPKCERFKPISKEI